MTLHQIAPSNSIQWEDIPKGYLERIVDELAAEGCQPVDEHNNLIRILLLIHRADENARSYIIESLIRLIYAQSVEFGDALTTQLSKLTKEVGDEKARDV